MSDYYLFLDDERIPQRVTWVELPPVSWVIVRTYESFVSTIEKYGLPKAIAFDHDLAPEHYDRFFQAARANAPFNYEGLRYKTGYDAAKWLVNYCQKNNLDVPAYYLHTKNHIGAANIDSLFKSYMKIKKLFDVNGDALLLAAQSKNPA
jgi:hypothetical protein